MPSIENLTIMFTDIVGFSKMVSTLSRNESQAILQEHDRILQKIIKRFGGQIIKPVGDSFLVIFRSPTDAVLCAMAMHDKLWEYNQQKPTTHQINIRVALNAGEVQHKGNDIFGDAVNIAARLESKTPAGAVLLTESVYLSMNKNEVNFKALGKHQFKGMTEAIAIYQAKANIPSPTTEQDLAPDIKKGNKANKLFTIKTKKTSTPYANYPYGGAHKHLKPVSRSRFTVSKVFVGLSAAIITAVATWMLTLTYMSGPNQPALDKVEVEYSDAVIQAKTELSKVEETENLPVDETVSVAVTAPELENTIEPDTAIAIDINAVIREKALPLLKAKDYEGVRKLVEQYQSEYPDNAYLELLLGHADKHFQNYESSLGHYSKALKHEPLLANDALLARNLVSLLEFQRSEASRLMGRYMSEPIIKRLSRRSGQAGLRGRYDAFYLLKDSGNPDKIDRVGLNIWDLRELKKCSLKKVAIQELRRLDDTRALPALREVANMNIFRSLRYTCLRSEVQAAVEQLEAKEKTAEAEAILNQSNKSQ